MRLGTMGTKTNFRGKVFAAFYASKAEGKVGSVSWKDEVIKLR